MMRPHPLPPGPGQESVWDYPRPAVAEPTSRHLQVFFNGLLIAETRGGFRVLETSHPPSYYFPPDAVELSCLVPNGRRTLCEWKGAASYYNVVVGDQVAPAACWTYPNPTPAFAPLQGFFTFYPAAMESCWVDGERVTPQPGGFYGGWITRDVVGPFKGESGTQHW